jgi:hypothetical protein
VEASAADSFITSKRQVVTGTVVGLATAKFQPLIRPMQSYAWLLLVQLHVHFDLDDFCLFSEQFCNVIVHVTNFEIHVLFADRRAPVKVTNSAEYSPVQ